MKREASGSLLSARLKPGMKARKPTLRQVQAVRCPTCHAAPGKKCQLSSGPRFEPHPSRQLNAADKMNGKSQYARLFEGRLQRLLARLKHKKR
jgi:hypothetical protein